MSTLTMVSYRAPLQAEASATSDSGMIGVELDECHPLPAESAMERGMGIPKRKGKWTPEEEVYTARIIQDFNRGYLPLLPGTTLRSYLSEKLNCDPMRITKKFSGEACIGKRVFQPVERTAENWELVRQSMEELKVMEEKFLLRLQLGKGGIGSVGKSGSPKSRSSIRRASSSQAAAPSTTVSPPSEQYHEGYGYYTPGEHMQDCQCGQPDCSSRELQRIPEQAVMSDVDASGLLLDFFKSVHQKHAEAGEGEGWSVGTNMLALGKRSMSSPSLSAMGRLGEAPATMMEQPLKKVRSAQLIGEHN